MDDEDIIQSSADFNFYRLNDAPKVISANFSTSEDYDYMHYSGDYNYSYVLVEETVNVNETFKYNILVYPFETTMLGIVRPILVLLTALTNAFVVGFFFVISRRKSSNLLFVSIAVSDSLTGIVLLPNSFFVFAGGSVMLSKNWCFFFMVTKFYVSRAFHTVSVWLTVTLSVQRLLCVLYPFITKRLCTYWKTAITILVIYIVAFVLHMYHVLDMDSKLSDKLCGWFVEDPCKHTCIHLWATVILQHLLPSLILLVLTTVTLLSLYEASKRVSHMSLSASPGAITRSSRDRTVTITSILIVIMFLIPELPYGVYKCICVIYLPGTPITSIEMNHKIFAIYEVGLMLSFHVNFWVYCCTMSDFRQAVLGLFACGRRRNRLSGGKFSRSSSYRNGSARTNISRTSSGTSRKRVLSNTTSILSTSSDFYMHPAGALPDKRCKMEEIRKLSKGDVANINPIVTAVDENRCKIENENSLNVVKMSQIIKQNESEKKN